MSTLELPFGASPGAPDRRPQGLPETWETWDAARLSDEVARHNALYWDRAAPEISDYDFDRLVERLRALDPHAPVLDALGPATPDATPDERPTLTAGEPGDPVTHAASMLSLDKAYDEATLTRWVEKFEGPVVMTPKVDGVACSVRYGHDGRLAVAATRGNGTVGEDITANVRRIPGVPEALPADAVGEGLEVRGEVYLPLTAFAALDGSFANPRNTAAGALKQKDPDRSARMGLRFFAYDLLGSDADTESGKFTRLAALGFTPVEHQTINRDAMQAGYEAFVARRAALDYEIDGVVFKADRLDEQSRLGSTSHHPRWAIAYKLQGESATTVLREVEWSVSRTGVLTPVGIVDPVPLSGATVTRISLHNWGMVQSKQLSLCATVVAMRRGGVIPYLEALVSPGDGEIRPPETCPSCHAPTRIEGDLVLCGAEGGCRAQSVAALAHFARAVGIEGFGPVWLEHLVDAGLLHESPDFFRLRPLDLLEFERMGETLANKLVAQIDGARTLPLEVFLVSLGVPDLGRSASRVLAARYGSLAAVRAATPEELVALPKFAERLAARVTEGLAERAAVIDALLEHVTVTDAPVAAPKNETGPLSGKSFLFTGTLAAMPRAEAQARVEALGGSAASGVSKGLSYLVVGSEGRAGSKLQKAEKAGVSILDEAAFLAFIEEAERGASSATR